MVARLMISPVVPDITGTFDITTGDIVLALTRMWTAYALSQYPGGVLASHVSVCPTEKGNRRRERD